MKVTDEMHKVGIKWRAEGNIKAIGDRKLFHYAGINTLHGILENKEIWFANAASMNDRKELRVL